MKKIKKLSALLLAVVFAISVVACGSESAATASASKAVSEANVQTEAAKTETKTEAQPAMEAAKTETKAETPAAAEAPKQDAAATRTVIDMSGTEVTIPAEVNTYVESWFAHNAVDVMLNQAEGMLVTCAKPETYQWMYLVCPRMNDAVYAEFSDTMNVEEIISMKPDVVFGSNENYRAMFENVGIPFVNCMFTTYDTMKQSIALTAQVLGEEAQETADRYFDYLDEKIAYVDEITSQIPEGERKYVAHGSSIYSMGIDGLNTIIDEWINLSGGINAAAKEIDGNLKEVTMEQLLAWDPDVIITGSTQDEVDSIMTDPSWAALTAVKNGEVYANPKGVFLWDRYGVEEALQFQWAAMTLYPELFKGYDIETEVKNFYHDFLNYDLSDDQVAHILAHEDPAEDDEIINGTAAAYADTRKVTDLDGNEVEIPNVVEKVAFTSWPAGEAITIMLEQKDTLASLSTYNSSNELLTYFYPELLDLPTTPDFQDNTLEEYIALDVQVVFCNANQKEAFDNVGIAAFVPDMSSPEGMQKTILMMGEIFGEKPAAKAKEYVEYYNGNIEKLEAASADIKDEDKPRVYYAAGGLTNTEGSGSITNYWTGAAGGVNVATENGIEGTFIDIDAETLLSWDPDIIVLRDAAYYQQLMDDPVLSVLSAVKNGTVYVAPKGIYNWAVRASEAAIMPLWAATIIQPELFADINIEQECRDFHKKYYGMDLTDDQVFQILHPAGV